MPVSRSAIEAFDSFGEGQQRRGRRDRDADRTVLVRGCCSWLDPRSSPTWRILTELPGSNDSSGLLHFTELTLVGDVQHVEARIVRTLGKSRSGIGGDGRCAADFSP